MNYNTIVSIVVLAAASPIAKADEPVRITTQGTKPMMEICQKISELFHWRISYEDPPVLDRSELVLGTAPSGVPWYQIRAVPVSFEVPAMQHESLPEYRRKVMDTAIAAYAHSGSRAAFRYTDDGEYIHVVPSTVAGPDGQSVPYESLLLTPVTIERGRYTINEILQAILAQFGRRAGMTVELGAVPKSFNQIMLTEEAHGEVARDVLTRVFYRQNGPRLAAGAGAERLYWMLTYMANGSQYFFVVDMVPAEFDAATIAHRSRVGDEPAQGAQPGQPSNQPAFGNFSSGASGNRPKPEAAPSK